MSLRRKSESRWSKNGNLKCFTVAHEPNFQQVT